MRQFFASAYLQPVLKCLKADTPNRDKTAGLLDQLSAFDVTGLEEAEQNNPPPSLLAVAANIVTRGVPTTASLLVEETLAGMFEKTEKVTGSLGNIGYEWSSGDFGTAFQATAFSLLHPVVPKDQAAQRALYTGDLDSNFEKAFLSQTYTPASHSYLTQLWMHQRARNSLGTHYGNQGRVDFSLEIPYQNTSKKTDRYKKEHKIQSSTAVLPKVWTGIY